MSHGELLRDVLAALGRAERTPLLLELDPAAIAGSALARHRLRVGAGAADREPPWTDLRAALDATVAAALRGDDRPPETVAPTGDRPAEDHLDELTAWIAGRRALLAGIDPQAASIVALRLDGLDRRDIAGALDTGRRLVDRVLALAADAW